MEWSREKQSERVKIESDWENRGEIGVRKEDEK